MKVVCLHCQYPMTWEQQRRQFSRLLENGLTKEQAKTVMPRCQKCTTSWMSTCAACIAHKRGIRSRQTNPA